jgi:hypothetical protein
VAAVCDMVRGRHGEEVVGDGGRRRTGLRVVDWHPSMRSENAER